MADGIYNKRHCDIAHAHINASVLPLASRFEYIHDRTDSYRQINTMPMIIYTFRSGHDQRNKARHVGRIYGISASMKWSGVRLSVPSADNQ